MQSKKTGILFLIITLLLTSATLFSYQGVLMNSAETINPGNFKLAIFPTMIIDRNGGDNIWGVAGKGGFGLTRNIDIEAKGAIFKNFNYFGFDLEYWFYRGRNINVSAAFGWHMMQSKIGSDSSGIDAAFIASTKPSKKLEIYSGIKLSFDTVKNSNRNFTLAHIVPGFEYRITSEIDFLGEFGISLNDSTSNYLSFGFAYYFLR
ncbi:MAG: hypothetical protein ABFR75_11485 [Acidobacteriota bacterium]